MLQHPSVMCVHSLSPYGSEHAHKLLSVSDSLPPTPSARSDEGLRRTSCKSAADGEYSGSASHWDGHLWGSGWVTAVSYRAFSYRATLPWRAAHPTRGSSSQPRGQLHMRCHQGGPFLVALISTKRSHDCCDVALVHLQVFFKARLVHTWFLYVNTFSLLFWHLFLLFFYRKCVFVYLHVCVFSCWVRNIGRDSSQSPPGTLLFINIK